MDAGGGWMVVKNNSFPSVMKDPHHDAEDPTKQLFGSTAKRSIVTD